MQICCIASGLFCPIKAKIEFNLKTLMSMKTTIKLLFALLLWAWFEMESIKNDTPLFENQNSIIDIYTLQLDATTQPLRMPKSPPDNLIYTSKPPPQYLPPFWR